MATTTSFEQIVNLGRETVKTTFEYIGETEAPLYKHFTRKKAMRLTEQGYRMPILTRKPGGHTSYNRSNVNFREPVAPESDSMRTYPAWYALPFKVDGSTLRDLKSGDANQFLSYENYMRLITEAAMKRLNYFFHGDGTGALAVCTSVLTGTGSATLNLQSLASSAAGEAETKGSVRLEVNQEYCIMNASTNAIKLIFTVTAILSKTSVTANVTTFTANTASGDPIVDAGATTSLSAYKKAPEGLRSLAANSGILQNVARADYTELKTPRVNGSDNPVNPYMFRQAKDLVRVAANDTMKGSNKLCVITPGQQGALCNQQFGLRRYEGNETVRGVASKFVDDDGDNILVDADGAEDRIYFLDDSSYKIGEQKSFGMFDEDGNQIRMLAGTNSSGSDAFAGSIGWGGNMIKDGLPKTDVYLDRLSQTDVTQQISLP